MFEASLTMKEKLLLVINMVFQQLVTVVMFSIIWTLWQERDWSKLGTYHILFSVLGFGFIMAEAVVVFNTASIITLGLKRIFRQYVHGSLMFLGCVSLTAGISLKISQRSKHFTDIHGKLGLAAMILSLIAMLGGVILLFSKKLAGTNVRPVWIKFCHTLLGFTAYLIGIIALGYGIHDHMHYPAHTANALVVLLGLYVGYSLVRPLMSLYEHTKGVISS